MALLRNKKISSNNPQYHLLSHALLYITTDGDQDHLEQLIALVILIQPINELSMVLIFTVNLVIPVTEYIFLLNILFTKSRGY